RDRARAARRGQLGRPAARGHAVSAGRLPLAILRRAAARRDRAPGRAAAPAALARRHVAGPRRTAVLFEPSGGERSHPRGAQRRASGRKLRGFRGWTAARVGARRAAPAPVGTPSLLTIPVEHPASLAYCPTR